MLVFVYKVPKDALGLTLKIFTPIDGKKRLYCYFYIPSNISMNLVFYGNKYAPSSNCINSFYVSKNEAVIRENQNKGAKIS